MIKVPKSNSGFLIKALLVACLATIGLSLEAYAQCPTLANTDIVVTNTCTVGDGKINATFNDGAPPFDAIFLRELPFLNIVSVPFGPVTITPISANEYEFDFVPVGNYLIEVQDPSDGCAVAAIGPLGGIEVANDPTPVVKAGQDKTICSGDPVNLEILLDPVNFPAGSTLDWPAPTMSMGPAQGTPGSGVSADPAGTIHIMDVLVNSTSSPITATYKITPTGPPSSSCAGAQVDIIITINPIPTITNLPGGAPDITICSGDLLSFTPTSLVAGAIFNWTRVAPPSISGNASGSGPLSETLVSTSNNVETVVYTYTVTGPAPELCTDGTMYTYTVDVDPTVTHTITNNNANVCENTASNQVDINYETLTSGGSISVQAAYGAILGGAYGLSTVLGAGPGTINEVLDNPTNAPVTVTYTFTTTANSCPALVEDIDVVVEPIPTITNLPGGAPDITICSGDPLSFTALSDVAGAIISWTSAAPASISGNTNGSGTLTDVLVSTSNNIETVVYTYTVTGPAPELCTDLTPYTYTVNVDPTVTHAITNNDAIVCTGVGVDIDYETMTQNGSISVQASYPGGVTGSVDYTISQILGTGPGTISETLTNVTTSSQTVNYTFTTTANSCPPLVEIINVVVDPIPVITNLPGGAPDITICSGDPLSFTALSDVAGAIISWTSAAPASISGNTNGSGTLTDVLVSTSNNIETVVYTYTVTGPAPELCTDLTPYTYTVNVDPTVTHAITNNDAIVCTGVGVDIDYETMTQNGSISVQASYPGGVTGSVDYTISQILGTGPGTISETLTNVTTSSQTVNYTFTTTANSCPPLVEIINVVVDPIPVITNLPGGAPDITICSGDPLSFTALSDVAGAIISWTSAAPASISGNTNGSGTLTDVLVSTSNNIETVVYTYTVTGPAPELCTDLTPYTYTVNVDPTVTHAITNNDAIVCTGVGVDIDYETMTQNGSISVQASYPGGVTGSVDYTISQILGTGPGTISETLTNVTTSSQTVNYTFTTTANSCPPLVEIINVVVDPIPVITNLPGGAPDITICSGDPLSFTALSDVAGAIISWTSAAPASISGNTNGSGTLTDVLVSTSNNIETVVYTYTVTGPAPELCTDLTPYTYTVNVDPTVTHAITNNDAIVCTGVGVDIDYETMTQNGSISVQASYPGGVTGSVDYTISQILGTGPGTISETLTNVTTSSQTVNYTFTTTANSCPPLVEIINVVVDPIPVITNLPGGAPDITICSGDPLSFTALSDVAGAIISWTSAAPASISGNTNGSGTLTDVLVSTSNNIETVVYTYTVTGPAPELCTDGTMYTYTVDVDPTVTHTITNNNANVCENTASNQVDINYETLTSGGSISVQAAYGAILGGAYGSSTVLGAGPGTINEVLDNPTNAPVTVTYTFTTTANSCPALVEDIDVVVEPIPTITNLPGGAPDITICSGDPLSFTALSDVVGAIPSWTSAAPASISGNTNGSGTLSDVLVSTSNNVETVVYTYTVTGPAPELCTDGTMYTYTVDVDPVSLGGNVGTLGLTSICEGNPTPSLDLTGERGLILRWERSTDGFVSDITDIGFAGSTSITDTPPSSGTYDYRAVVQSGVCPEANSSLISITVNPLPVVTFTGLNISHCIDEAPVLLTGDQAPSGTFSGPGITDNGDGTATFDPSVAGLGGQSILYSFTDLNGCIGADVQPTTVVPLPTVSFTGLAPSYCESDSPASLSGTPIGTGGIWTTTAPGGLTDNGDGTADFDPAGAGGGTWDVTFTYTDSNSCSDFVTQSVIINPLTDPVFTGSTLVCLTAPSVSYSVVAGQTNYIWSVSTGGTVDAGGSTTDNFVDVTWTGAGTENINVTFTDINGCVVNRSEPINIFNSTPLPTVTTPVDVCQSDPAPALTIGGYSGQTVTWYDDATLFSVVGSGEFYTPSASELDVNTPGLTSFYVTQTIGTCGESAPSQIDVIVNPLPNAGTDANVDACETETSINLFNELGGTPDGGGVWNDDDGSGALVGVLFNPSVAGPGTFNFTYTATSPGCVDDQSVVTMVVEAQLDPGTDVSVGACIIDTSLDLFTVLGGSPDTSGTWADVDGSGALTGSIFDPSTAGTGTFNFTYSFSGLVICTNSSATVTVTVGNVSPPPILDGPSDICAGDPAPVLSAIGTNVEWYAEPALTTLLGSGNSYTPGIELNTALPGTTQYYVTQDVGCGQSTPAPYDVNVLALSNPPSIASVSDLCLNDPIPQLVATGTDILWHSDILASDTLATGSVFIPAPGQLDTDVIGTISFFATQNTGCGRSTTTEIVINVINCAGSCFTQNIVSNTASCLNIDGSVNFNLDGNEVLPVSFRLFELSGTDTVFQQIQSGSFFDSLSTATYDYEIIDSQGCAETGQVTVQQRLSTLDVTLTTPTNINCVGEQSDIDVTVTNGTAPFEYSTDGGLNWQTLVSNRIQLVAGIYDIYVRDDPTDPCPFITTGVDITSPNALTYTIEEPTESFPERASGTIKITDVTGGLPPYQVHAVLVTPLSTYPGQSFDQTFDIPFVPEIGKYEILLDNLFAGTYMIEIIDANMCPINVLYLNSDPLVPLDDSLFIPNVFTPNEDGYNDQFFIRNLPDDTDTQLTITNRVGKKVFNTNSYKNDWDGGNLPNGIYYYTVHITVEGQPFEYKGWVEIWKGQ